MKFKTIVITRRKIAAAVLAAAAIAAAAAAVCFFKYTTSAESVFLHAASVPILKSELSDGSNSSISPVSYIRRLLAPESILRSYSAVFPDSTAAPSLQPATAAPQESSPPPTAAPTPEPTPTPAPTATPYAEPVKNSSGMKINNATKFPADLSEAASRSLSFTKGDGPLVLIMHTHTTESYIDSAAQNSDRSTDSSKNMIAIGEEIAAVLEQNGISTVHDTTVHDYPSYNGAYTRAMATIKANLEKYPSIQIVLDVHRDGLVKADGTKLKVVCDIDGKQTAQTMLVVGTNGLGLSHGNWKENLTFAAKIQKKACQDFPDLMRPLNLREERFNQHLTKGSLILEIGSNGNTMAEAKLGASKLASAIADVINEEVS